MMGQRMMLTTALLVLLPLAVVAALGHFVDDNASPLTGGRAHLRQRRSATEELRRLRRCDEEERHCSAATCGCPPEEGPDDYKCLQMCVHNCGCGCAGYPRGGMDYGPWLACTQERRCEEEREACYGRCGDRQECEDACILDLTKCVCECVQLAGTRAGTSSTSTAAINHSTTEMVPNNTTNKNTDGAN